MKPDMHLPFLPLDFIAVHGKADALRLGNKQRLQIRTFLDPVMFLHQIGKEFTSFTRWMPDFGAGGAGDWEGCGRWCEEGAILIASCGDIDRQDFVRIGVQYLRLINVNSHSDLLTTHGIEIQGVCIHVTVLLEPRIRHTLLHPRRRREPLIVSDRPAIAA